MNNLYLECMSGISGDMTVAALLDLGADRQLLIDGLKSLNISGYHIGIERVKKCGIDSCSFDVHLHQPECDNDHSHDNQDNYGDNSHSHHHKHEHKHRYNCNNAHEDKHNHCHGNEDSHNHEHNCHNDHGDKHNHKHDHEDSHNHERNCHNDHGDKHNHKHGNEGNHKHQHNCNNAHDDKHNHCHGNEGNHKHQRNCNNAHDDKHNHGNANEDNHSHDHQHRGIADILPIIENSAISPKAKEIAVRIFNILAKAEAKAHGIAVEEVHFHEVGAIDSIVDITAAAICLDNLDIGSVYCTPLREGTGTVRCQHGVMPVPVPATMEIAKEYDIPLVITQNVGEMITPTGAAIVAAITDVFSSPKQMILKAYGYGAGKKDFETANILRASIFESQDDLSDEDVIKIECNIDDMTGEALAYAAEKLFAAGALDVWFTPIYMKKSRPGYLLSIIAPPALKDELVYKVFAHTSTIGVRCEKTPRVTMERKNIEIETPYGKVAAKESCYKDICKTKVEFEDAKKLADANNLTVTKILSTEYNK